MKARALAIAVCLAATMAVAHADELDYRPENGGWNGLSDFFALARGSGPAIEMSGEIDWDAIGKSDVLMLLYPKSDLDPKALRNFVRSGGRVIIADDFGNGSKLLEALDVQRRDFATVTGQPRLFSDNPNLPIASVQTQAPGLAEKLTARIAEIVTNHPALIESDKHEIVFGFGARDGVVVAGEIGSGSFVAISDPSILINVMLGFEGNFAFATNLVRTFAPTSADRIVVIAQEFTVKGQPPTAPPERKGLAGRIGEVLVAFNGFLDELNDYLAPDSLFRWIVRLLLIPLVIVLLMMVPWGRGQVLDGRWTRPQGAVARLEPHELVKRFDAKAVALPFNYPAAILRDDVERSISGAIGEPDPMAHHPSRILALLHERTSPRAAELATRLLPKLRSLPTRQHAAQAWAARFVTRKEFETLFDESRALQEAIDTALADRRARTVSTPSMPSTPSPPSMA